MTDCEDIMVEKIGLPLTTPLNLHVVSCFVKKCEDANEANVQQSQSSLPAHSAYMTRTSHATGIQKRRCEASRLQPLHAVLQTARGVY